MNAHARFLNNIDYSEDSPITGAMNAPTGDAPLVRDSMSRGDYIEAVKRAERKPFQPYFDEAIEAVKAKRFYSMKELGAYFGKRSDWVTRLKEVSLKQGYLTLADWTNGFTRSERNGRPPCGRDGMSERERMIASSPYRNLVTKPAANPAEDLALTSPDGMAEEPQHVLERVQAHQFKSEDHAVRFYRCKPVKWERMRAAILDMGLTDVETWKSYFKNRRECELWINSD